MTATSPACPPVARATKPASLIVVESSGPREVLLDRPVTVVGRDGDVALGGFQVSRRHALIEHNPRGYSVLDMGSSNGVRINDVVLPPWRRLRLRNGDVVVLGNVTLVFKLVAGPGAVSPRGQTRAASSAGEVEVGEELQPGEALAVLESMATTARSRSDTESTQPLDVVVPPPAGLEESGFDDEFPDVLAVDSGRGFLEDYETQELDRDAINAQAESITVGATQDTPEADDDDEFPELGIQFQLPEPEAPEEGPYGLVISGLTLRSRRTAAVGVLCELLEIEEGAALEMVRSPVVTVLRQVSLERAEAAAERFREARVSCRVTHKRA
jgi:pSer/pThr/pTyr-binding forkhead associated (FHA) protein